MALPVEVRVHLLSAESRLMSPHMPGKWMFVLLASACSVLGQTPPPGGARPLDVIVLDQSRLRNRHSAGSSELRGALQMLNKRWLCPWKFVCTCLVRRAALCRRTCPVNGCSCYSPRPVARTS